MLKQGGQFSTPNRHLSLCCVLHFKESYLRTYRYIYSINSVTISINKVKKQYTTSKDIFDHSKIKQIEKKSKYKNVSLIKENDSLVNIELTK